LVKEHSHAVNAAVSGLSALPGTGQSFAATRAMSRFLNHPDIPCHALLEPAQDAVRSALASCPSSFALVVHDWCMFGLGKHPSKKDRIQRSHETDLGYELGTALVVAASDGRPLGPMELRLRTANGMLSTRVGPAEMPAGHVDEVLDAMTAARGWNLGKQLVHVIDREADSVGHYRDWHSRGHRFVVRADDDEVIARHNKMTGPHTSMAVMALLLPGARRRPLLTGTVGIRGDIADGVCASHFAVVRGQRRGGSAPLPAAIGQALGPRPHVPNQAWFSTWNIQCSLSSWAVRPISTSWVTGSTSTARERCESPLRRP
jgi:hypothetical protein